MSWSISANGTKRGARVQLGNATLYGSPSAEEKAKFEFVRGFLLDLVNGAPEGSGIVTTISVSAGGHGTAVGSLSFSYQQHADPPESAS